eukprot:14207943-Ditylum_brightwellii.AAC.1
MVEDNNEEHTSAQNNKDGEDTNEIANGCSIHDQDIPASTVNNTVFTQEDLPQKKNKNETNHVAKETIDDHSYHDEELAGSTVNNTVCTPDDSNEENENVINHDSLDEQDNGNDNIHSPDHSDGEDANKTINGHTFHDQELS